MGFCNYLTAATLSALFCLVGAAPASADILDDFDAAMTAFGGTANAGDYLSAYVNLILTDLDGTYIDGGAVIGGVVGDDQDLRADVERKVKSACGKFGFDVRREGPLSFSMDYPIKDTEPARRTFVALGGANFAAQMLPEDVYKRLGMKIEDSLTGKGIPWFNLMRSSGGLAQVYRPNAETFVLILNFEPPHVFLRCPA